MRHVLITGASTGIGFATAQRFHALGYNVWAGVRKQQDANLLVAAVKDAVRMRPLILDVTKPDQIHSAFQTISSEGYKIDVLVNNAGIAVVGVIEFLEMAEVRNQFDVNFFGLLSVTQKFLPMIRETKGRIVNISSIAGITVTPGLTPYNASKHCVEVLSDALRIELKKFGAKVILIEPGTIRTPIWDKELGAVEVQPPYEEICNSFNYILGSISKGGLPPEAVAQVIDHAVHCRSPKARYLVGRDAKLLSLQNHLPTFLKDYLIARAFRV